MALLGHDISQHSPTITRPSYNLGRVRLRVKQPNRHNFILVGVHTEHWTFFRDIKLRKSFSDFL